MVAPFRALLRAVFPAFVLAVLAFSSAPAMAEPRVALVVGNRGAEGPDALTPANDAGLMVQTLREAGFDVVQGADLDLNGLRRGVREFLDKVEQGGPGTEAVVYLAGQGLQFEGDNWFVPTGARIERASDIAMEAFRLGDLVRSLAALPGDVRIVMIDAARPFPPLRDRAPIAPGLAAVDPPPGFLVSYSTAPDLLLPPSNGPYGPYASAFVEMLREPGLGLDELFGRIRVRVHEQTQGVQTPWSVNKVSVPFLFLPPREGQGIATPLPPPQRNRQLADMPPEEAYAFAVERDTISAYQEFLRAFPNDRLAARVKRLLWVRREALFWQRSVARNTPRAYWTYLRTYPSGPHEADARRRLERLAAALEPPPSFEEEVYDLPPPVGDEFVGLVSPDVIYDEPLPPPPQYLLAPPPPSYLPPPPPPPRYGMLPIPIPIPMPGWARQPRPAPAPVVIPGVATPPPAPAQGFVAPVQQTIQPGAALPLQPGLRPRPGAPAPAGQPLQPRPGLPPAPAPTPAPGATAPITAAPVPAAPAPGAPAAPGRPTAPIAPAPTGTAPAPGATAPGTAAPAPVPTAPSQAGPRPLPGQIPPQQRPGGVAPVPPTAPVAPGAPGARPPGPGQIRPGATAPTTGPAPLASPTPSPSPSAGAPASGTAPLAAPAPQAAPSPTQVAPAPAAAPPGSAAQPRPVPPPPGTAAQPRPVPPPPPPAAAAPARPTPPPQVARPPVAPAPLAQPVRPPAPQVQPPRPTAPPPQMQMARPPAPPPPHIQAPRPPAPPRAPPPQMARPPMPPPQMQAPRPPAPPPMAPPQMARPPAPPPQMARPPAPPPQMARPPAPPPQAAPQQQRPGPRPGQPNCGQPNTPPCR